MRVLSVLLLCLMPAAASASAHSAVTRHAEVSLLAGWAEGDGRRVAGLRMVLAPGWKTYWRAPGEGGLAPEFDWSGSRNLAAVAVEWPRPGVFDSFGLRTLGYAEEVVLPLVVTPEDAAEPVHLALDLHYGVCAEICVPEQVSLALDIPPGASGDTAAIAAHRARVPTSAGVREARCAVRGAGEARAFEARIDLEGAAEAPMVLIEGPANAWFGPAGVVQDGGRLAVSAEVQVFGEPQWIGRDALRLTLLWPDRAIDVQGCAALGP